MCVTPNIRSQAKADNAAAAARRNSIKVSAFSSGGRWQLNVSNINNGRALIVLKAPERPHAQELDGERVRQPASRWPPGALTAGSADDSYFLVQDPISKRVGRSQNVSANCVRID